jgi:hypothetical protein
MPRTASCWPLKEGHSEVPGSWKMRSRPSRFVDLELRDNCCEGPKIPIDTSIPTGGMFPRGEFARVWLIPKPDVLTALR